MSQTKKKKTEEAKVEVAGNFRLKITNLKKTAFPDPLKASDYHGYKVGDILVKGRTSNTVFEIVDITRESFPEYQYDGIFKGLHYNDRQGNLKCKDENLLKLIEKYRTSHNFGACWITIKTLVRAGKAVTTSRTTRFCEVNFYKNNPTYHVTDLAAIANTNNSAANYIDYQINRLQAKQKRHRDVELVVLDMIKAKVDASNPKPKKEPKQEPPQSEATLAVEQIQF